MRKRLVFAGAALAGTLLGHDSAARAEVIRMSPAACSRVDRLLTLDARRRTVTTGTPTYGFEEFITSFPFAYNAGSKQAAFVCPVPDTQSNPAAGLSGVNVHVTDRSTSQAARAFVYSKLWSGPGFTMRSLGKTGANAATCTRDPDCTIQASLAIPDDGNFYAVVVVLPPKGRAVSELSGLFFY